MQILIILSLITTGAIFTRFFFRKVPLYIALALWLFSGTIIFSWIYFLITAVSSYRVAQFSVVILSICIITYLYITTIKPIGIKILLKRISLLIKTFIQSLMSHKTVVILFILWTSVFSYLAVTHNFMKTQDGLFSGGSAYGDLALHSTLVNFFASQTQLDLTSPIYATEPTTYPFLLNFLAGQLLRTGMSLQASLIFTSLPFMVLFLVFLWYTMRSAGGNTIAWVMASTFFLLSGGIGIIYFFTDWKDSSLSLWEFLLNQPVAYAHYANMGLYWSNIVTDYFIPQRAIVIGLSLALLLFAVFFRLWKKPTVYINELFGISILIGLIPFFHIHTFIVLFPLLSWCLLILFLNKKISLKILCISIGLSAILAAPQLYWQFFHTFSESFIRLQLGWMSGDTKIIIFWLRNWGLSTILWIITAYVAIFSKQLTPLRILIIPLLILFILTNIIIFQPNDYDNMKLMLFAYLIVCLTSGLVFEKIVVNRKNMILPILIFTTLLTLTGFVTILREITLRWQIADTPSQDIARIIQDKTDPSQIFLTSDHHNHPVPMLAGRKVLLGYRGWLWTHGINYQQVEKDVQSMFAGETNTIDLLKKYNIDYVFIGQPELISYYVNISFYNKNFEKIISNPTGDVYKIELK